MVARLLSIRNVGDERGSILVLTTLLLPVLVALGALTLGVTSLSTSHLDAQRGVDLAALAGAADIPTANVDPAYATLPTPVAGSFLVRKLDSFFEPTDWKDRPCAVLRDQLTGNRSIVYQASGGGTGSTDCATWVSESPTLAALAACAGNLLDVPGCGTTLRSTLAQTLPILNTTQPDVTDAMAKAATVASNLTNTADTFVTKADAAALKAACLVKVLNTCTLTLAQKLLSMGTSKLEAAGLSPTGDLQLGVDLNGLAPAVMTPRLQVDLQGASVQPTLSPFRFGLSASATARRTIKSALVLPSLGIPVAGGWDPDPNDLNRVVLDSDAPGKLLDAVDFVDRAVDHVVIDTLLTTACKRAVISSHCPQMDGVVATDTIRNEFLQDLRDATTPPPAGTQPTIKEMLDGYAQSGEPVWAVAPLRRLKLDQVLTAAGLSSTDLAALKLLNPSLGSLLTNFAFIPALDVVPVTVEKVTTASGPKYTLKRINDITATNGLFQARLVK